MKSFLKSFVFAYISVYVTQLVIHGYYFDVAAKMLLVLALTLISLFARPLLKMLSLPTGGIGYFIINFILTFVTIYLLTIFIPNFGFLATTTQNLNIFGIMLPSKHLTAWWAGVASAAFYCVTVQFLHWLGAGKK